MGGDDGLIISARFSSKRGASLHSAIWGKIVDALFWLQLTWIFSGFLLMAYFALKVFPGEKQTANSRSDSAPQIVPRPELITLGNYRFEIAAETPRPQSNVIELYPTQPDKNAGLR